MYSIDARGVGGIGLSQIDLSVDTHDADSVDQVDALHVMRRGLDETPTFY